MRAVREGRFSPSTNEACLLAVTACGSLLPCLLDGLERMRPELGGLADDLIHLLGAAAVSNGAGRGVQEP